MEILRRLGRLLGMVAALGVLGTLGTVVTAAYATRPLETHSTDLKALVTSLDNSSRIVNVQGVGCSVSICSRVAIRHSDRVSSWLDTIASISEITKNDALFVFKDGSARRLPIVNDNRYLYFGHAYIGSGKIDMAKLKSVEFKP